MPTIKDVARAAGVSVATVSRVFNNEAVVRADTRDRVQVAAEALGYAPHAGARSLIMRRTLAIGLLLPDLYGEFFSELIHGVDEEAHRGGYHLLLARVRDHRTELSDALRTMRGRVDGLIYMAPHLDPEPNPRRSVAHFPILRVSSPPELSPSASLAVANVEGARAMVHHFADLGHRRIAIIRGAEHNYDAAERLRGYRLAMEERGLPLDPALELPGDFTEDAGHAAAERILALAERPTAVFASNDGMALGALSAFRSAGVRVPGDIALGGFDDIPLARHVEPALTTVHVDIRALGVRAASRLLAAISDPTRTDLTRETMPATLVVRRSCGAPGEAAPGRPTTV
jgi:LacI family transcriptional regulator